MDLTNIGNREEFVDSSIFLRKEKWEISGSFFFAFSYQEYSLFALMVKMYGASTFSLRSQSAIGSERHEGPRE